MLETLTIEKCEELKQIIDTGDHNSTSGNSFGNVFPKLKMLRVAKCVQLEYIFGHYNHDHQKQTEMAKLELNECPQLASSGDLIKELSHNEENGQQMNLSLETIKLIYLPMMRCLFVGLKYSFVLNNLTEMKIVLCEKLEIVFSTSVLRCLPQLVTLEIEKCKELKHIIEDDLEDKKFQSSNTFFPKLETLFVTECDQLKDVFPVSICKELPMLKFMLIREANELEEIFKSDKKDEIEEISKSEVQIPNLKAVGFANLPSLCHAQEVHFQAVKHRFVHSCQKLSLTSCNMGDLDSGDFMKGYLYFRYEFDEIRKECVKAASEDKLTSPQLEGSTSEITEAATVSTITETKNKLPTQEVGRKQKGIQIYVEEGNTSTHLDVAGSSSGQLVTSECKTSSHEDDDSQIAMNSFSISTTETNDQEDPSQKVEDLSSLLVKSELEQLVSKNHMDCGNFYLLNDFFVKHPSVRLKDTSLSNGYKGCAYNVLAKLLKFLKTHSILEVLGSCHSEFVELLQDARNFGFDKDWLDGVERRTVCHDMQVSEDELKKLMDSKEHLTKQVEVLRLKIGILSEQMEVLSEHVEVLKQQLASSESVLESINQQEVALSAPVGY